MFHDVYNKTFNKTFNKTLIVCADVYYCFSKYLLRAPTKAFMVVSCCSCILEKFVTKEFMSER